jgi:hypothetical protein
MKVAIVTDRKEGLQDFVRGLGGDVDWFAEPGAFFDQAAEVAWNLVVVDGLLPGLEVRVFLQDLLQTNSLLHTAVVSDMTEPELFQHCHGMGVLCAVPAVPDWNDGVRVMNQLCLFYDMG